MDIILPEDPSPGIRVISSPQTIKTSEADIPYQPTASVIIANYNYGHFVGEAIDSALSQQYPGVEVVVVDDGSSDNSRKVIEAYADRVVPVFQANGGQGAAISAGFQASKGDLVFPLDADDVFLPGRISTVIDALGLLTPEARRSISMVRSRMAFWRAPDPGTPIPDLDSVGLGGPRKQPHSHTIHPAMPAEKVLNGRLISLVAGTALVREKAERFMPVPDAFKIGGADTFWSTMAYLHGTVLDIPEVLALYRVHDTNAFTTADVASQSDFHVHTEVALYEHLRSLGYDPTMRFNAILGLRHASAETAARFPLKSRTQRLRHLLRAAVPAMKLTVDMLHEAAFLRRRGPAL